jgi:hypothetical protein
MTHEVFISYSHHDKAIADGVCANLEQAGIRCWIAPRDIAPGYDWPTAISDAIDHSRVLVLIFSSRSNSSQDVGRELILAANNNCIIVPFKIEDLAPEPGKKYYLARTHWLDAMDPPTHEQVDALVKCVHSLLLETGGDLAVTPSITQPASPTPMPAKKIKALPWILGTLVLVLGIGAALLWTQRGKISSLFAPSDTPAPTVTPTLHPTITPTHILQPTATATPIPAWVTDFAQPILAALAGQPPDFQDDFSLNTSGWKLLAGTSKEKVVTMEVSKGVLVLMGEGQSVFGTETYKVNYKDLVLQVDINILRLTPGCYATVQWGGGGDGPGRMFVLLPDGWRFTSIFLSQDQIPFSAYVPSEGSLSFKSSGVHTITIISNDPEFSVSLDGDPVTYIVDISRPPNSHFSFWLWVPDPNICAAEFDNLKVWNISDLP